MAISSSRARNDLRDSFRSSLTHGNRFGILVTTLMLFLSAVAWLVSTSLMKTLPTMNMGTQTAGAALPLLSLSNFFKLDLGNVSLFTLVWVIGMVAMMFPAMIPVVSIYSVLVAKSAKRAVPELLLKIPIFLTGYLLLYVILGLVAFSVTYLAFYFSSLDVSLSAYAIPAASAILLGTGLWQLTPLKDRCLSRCVSPMGFFFTHMKKGFGGAFRMGAEHGLYCVGCCWMYMLVMLAVEGMSIPSMLLLGVMITIEKALVKGAMWFRYITAVIFCALGVSLLLLP